MKKTPVFISFPCSGRTWIKGINDEYLGSTRGAVIDFSTMRLSVVNTVTDRVIYTHDILDAPQDDILKWWAVAETKSQYKDEPLPDWMSTLAIITRDPRDVIVSYFHQKKYREPFLLEIGHIKEGGSFAGDLDEFVNDDTYGIRMVCEFMNLWVDHLEKGKAIQITYEGMHEDTPQEMGRALSHMGFDVDNRLLLDAIDKNTFNKAKKQELENFNVVFHVEGQSNALKRRKGKVGGWKTELTGETLKTVEDVIDKHLNEYYRPLYAQSQRG
jgi:hypothetical protein